MNTTRTSNIIAVVTLAATVVMLYLTWCAYQDGKKYREATTP